MSLPSPDEARKALKNPLRRRLLPVFIANQPLSPKEAAALIGEPLPSVSYHVKKLVKLHLLVLHSREPVRGAIKNYYVPNEAILDLPSIREILTSDLP